MNLKLLIFGVFTAWLVLCTKWYVCEIQQSCYEDTHLETSSGTIVKPVTQPLAVATEPETRETFPKIVEKKPEVVKTAQKEVKTEKKIAARQNKPAKVIPEKSTAPAEKMVAKSSNLTAKGGSPVVSATNTTSRRNTRQVLVEKEKNRLTICLPQQYTEKSLRKAAGSYLDELAKQWKKTGGRILITGHTDFVGSADANYEVGMERARSVRDILKSMGIPASRITCTSEGEDMPRSDNDTPYGRFRNRRVEVVIKK